LLENINVERSRGELNSTPSTFPPPPPPQVEAGEDPFEEGDGWIEENDEESPERTRGWKRLKRDREKDCKWVISRKPP